MIEENCELKTEVSVLKSRITHLETVSRRNNLILHGIPEVETNQEQLMASVLTNLNGISEKTKESEWDKWEISNAYTLGKKTNGKIRPILITTTLVWRKNLVLKNNT